jgi:lipoprotein Spr
MASLKRLIFILLWVAPQAVASQSLAFRENEAIGSEHYMRNYFGQVFGVNPDSIREPALFAFMEPWLGTPYKYAGNSKKGIDCSGFANQVYSSIYCTPIAGGCEHIFKRISLIDKNDLIEGDLVFFRINPKYTVSHVGVYIGEGKFVHASVKNGVIVSRLDEPYYSKYYKSGGRIPVAYP